MHFPLDDPGPQRGFKVRHLMINVQSVCRPGFLCGNGEVAGVRCGTTCWYPYAVLWSSFSLLQPCASKCAPKLHPTAHTEKSRLPKRHVSPGAQGEHSSRAKNLGPRSLVKPVLSIRRGPGLNLSNSKNKTQE